MHQIGNWIITNYLEVIAAIFGVLGVYLTAKQKIWCWPVGLLNVILSIIVYYQSKLYADVVLQFFYLGMTLYGWYFWVFGGNIKFHLPIRNFQKKEIIVILATGTLFTFLSGYFFSTYTHADYPYWDSFLMVWGIMATWAMAKKIIHHWLMWIIIDINGSILYFIKHLFAFSVLYIIFTILAIIGYFLWKNEVKKQTNT